MALVAGQIGTVDPLIVVGALPGRVAGLEVTDFDFFTGILVPPDGVGVQGAVAAGGAAGAPGAAGAAVAGQIDEPGLNSGRDWFERIHAFPDDDADNPQRDEGHEIAFGNILAQVEEEYELYSAYRHDPTTLNTITINVAPGIETPDVTPPVVLGPQVSILHPSSTVNTDGVTGLGVPVRTNIRALADGLPNFRGTVDFEFSSGDVVFLLLSGSRISLITAEYESDLREGMAWLTDIIEARDGGEQRIALRKQPRESWEVLFALTDVDDAERQRMQALLFDWQANAFGLPLWHEKLSLTAAVSSGATSYPVVGADDVDLRVGGLAAIISDPYTFDVLTITAVTDTQVDADSPSANGYPAGTVLVPVRTVRIVNLPGGTRFPAGNLERFRISFESTDNDTGAPAADASAFNTYNGRVLFDDCNVMQGELAEEFDRRVIVVDNSTGIVSQSSPWDRHKRGSRKGFVARSRAEIKSLKAALRAIRGRQKAFYLPTFIEDLTVVLDIGIGTATLDVTNIGYVRFVKNREPKATFRITFTDGTSLVRVVQSSAVVSSTVERLTLDTTWPANRTIAEVQRVQFLELVRFDTDELTLQYPRNGLARVFSPVKVVFDDD